MSRLRPLTEAEIYTRLYGVGEPAVTVIHSEPGARRPSSDVGEEIRRLFEERLDARQTDAPGSEEAA